LKDKITIVGNLPPAIFSTGTGRYVASGAGWVEVPRDTTLDDIEWSKPATNAVEPAGKIETHLVPGSNNDCHTVILYPDGNVSCSCWGFRRWRKPCKHIKMIRGEL